LHREFKHFTEAIDRLPCIFSFFEQEQLAVLHFFNAAFVSGYDAWIGRLHHPRDELGDVLFDLCGFLLADFSGAAHDLGLFVPCLFEHNGGDLKQGIGGLHGLEQCGKFPFQLITGNSFAVLIARGFLAEVYSAVMREIAVLAIFTCCILRIASAIQLGTWAAALFNPFKS
jgi:hypothetical protein